MAAFEARVLHGGHLDLAQPKDAKVLPQSEKPKVIIGRYYIKGNAGVYDQFVDLANVSAIAVASDPKSAVAAVRRVEEGVFALFRPCKDGEEGLAVTRRAKDHFLQISKLFEFLTRNKIVPDKGTVLVCDAELGTDETLGNCVIANVTTAKVREVEKRPKKPQAEKPASATPPAPTTPPAMDKTK